MFIAFLIHPILIIIIYQPYPLVHHIRYLGNFFAYFKLLAITLVVSGQNPFPILGLATPRAWVWSQENKVSYRVRNG